MKQRVVVTGVGMVTPLGTGVEKNWAALCRGQSGIGPITRFNASSLKCQVAGEVKDFNPKAFVDERFIVHFDPFIQYAMAASMMAVEDSGLEVNKHNQNRVGVVIGTACGANTY
ncbi:MAG: beta-ketoacyl-[acyl-carrier-protein] synthase II, partial [Dehalococcoidia bacterium]|nr:beta-ketoacyl-[acyl-carrier-protein] synthase II [Dehalococcoidia bacterium]